MGHASLNFIYRAAERCIALTPVNWLTQIFRGARSHWIGFKVGFIRYTAIVVSIAAQRRVELGRPVQAAVVSHRALVVLIAHGALCHVMLRYSVVACDGSRLVTKAG